MEILNFSKIEIPCTICGHTIRGINSKNIHKENLCRCTNSKINKNSTNFLEGIKTVDVLNKTTNFTIGLKHPQFSNSFNLYFIHIIFYFSVINKNIPKTPLKVFGNEFKNARKKTIWKFDRYYQNTPKLEIIDVDTFLFHVTFKELFEKSESSLDSERFDSLFDETFGPDFFF